MSYHDPATEHPATAEHPTIAEHQTTAEQPAYGEFSVGPTATTTEQPVYDFSPDGPTPPEDDGYLDDDHEEWVNEAPKGLRVRGATGVLLLLLFAASGFWGGSVLQKHHDKSKGTTSTASAIAAARAASGGRGTGAGGGSARSAGGTGTSGAGGGGGFARNGTIGIVTTIEGSTVYLTDNSGNLIKVTTTPSSAITKTVSGTLADLQPGQTVVVQGSKAADGSTTARSITIAGSGLSGLGGGGGGGGGAGGGGGGGGGAGAAGGGGG
ncbi:MAG TPA: hypothetical protein VLL25_12500 [Acidimicrobiales bacterium]|nr:hypothetical protein [Acidimicrobiales bacterium]